MGMAAQLWLAGLLATASSSTLAAAPEPATTTNFGPSEAAARLRAPEVFNAVHHAMRQWGSSLHHNGMSFYLATVPEGVLLHHGNGSPDSPAEPDWLAYEIEHAENFARGGRPGGGPPPPSSSSSPPRRWFEPQSVLGATAPDRLGPPGEDDGEAGYGYLHTYKTTRPLQFLYVDGMGGGKTAMGTLDSQDYLLRGLNSSAVDALRLPPGAGGQSRPRPPAREGGGRSARGGGPMGEQQRAADLCALCAEWQLQGVIRMEAGFEIIKCDFSDGLEEVQVLRRPGGGVQGGGRDDGRRGGGGPGVGGGGPGPGRGMPVNLEFIRGISERYQGIGSARTIVDYSSMVSAFFYPVNLSNPDPKRPDLPRLSLVNATELALIKHDLGGIIADRRRRGGHHPPPPDRGGGGAVDWQGVSDLIVARYADRIQFMAEEINSTDEMARMVDFLLTPFIDFSEGTPDIPVAVERCAGFYLHPVRPATGADRLVKAAFETVTHQICASLSTVYGKVAGGAAAALETDPHTSASALTDSRSVLQDLMGFLRWTRFKRCPACAVSEVCMIPMWPMGTVEEYNSPRCTNGSDIREGVPYWGHGGPGGGEHGGPPPRF